jgi:hypothetical protein
MKKFDKILIIVVNKILLAYIILDIICISITLFTLFNALIMLISDNNLSSSCLELLFYIFTMGSIGFTKHISDLISNKFQGFIAVDTFNYFRFQMISTKLNKKLKDKGGE